MQLGNMAAPSTVVLYTVGGLLAYLLVPYVLRLPAGRRTFLEYLDDIRLTRVRPVGPLLLLTLSCLAILIVSRGLGSIVYQLAHGQALTLQSVGQVFDLSAALPPRSTVLFRQMFSSLEEVAFRGVFLTMLLRRYSPRTAIVISASAFGLLHASNALFGASVVVTLGQVCWAFLYGLFYGYLFIKSASLLPSMVIHWLSNVFTAPLTGGWQAAPVLERAAYGVVFGYGLAALLSILWVRFFTARWLPGSSAVQARLET
jgi:membrane protease YdiL (CAAX protease family)